MKVIFKGKKPVRATEGSSGYDLVYSPPKGEGAVTLEPGASYVLETGLSIEIPPGYEAQVRPRSGLAAKHGITVLNSPGTIDSDYRGEIKVILINHSPNPFTAYLGMRIAQLVFAKVEHPEWVDGEMEDTERGEGGFGSTGLQEIEEEKSWLQRNPKLRRFIGLATSPFGLMTLAVIISIATVVIGYFK